jgi:hypothetical protein
MFNVIHILYTKPAGAYSAYGCLAERLRAVRLDSVLDLENGVPDFVKDIFLVKSEKCCKTNPCSIPASFSRGFVCARDNLKLPD